MASSQQHQSYLFLVRFWSEEAKEVRDWKELEWRGRVQYVLSGEARSFHDWPSLIDLLLEMSETDRIEVRAQGAKIQEVAP